MVHFLVFLRGFFHSVCSTLTLNSCFHRLKAKLNFSHTVNTVSICYTVNLQNFLMLPVVAIAISTFAVTVRMSKLHKSLFSLTAHAQ